MAKWSLGRIRRSERIAASRESAGFTLVELLIAITLTGLILVAMYSGLRLGTRASETAERYAAASEEQRAIQGFLRRQLSQIYPLLFEEEGEREVLFSGERQSIYYAVVSPVRGELGGAYMAGLELRPSPRGRQLVYRYWPAQPELEDPFTPPPDAPAKVLLEGVTKLEFGYYGKQEGVLGWEDTWNETLRLPRRVRLRLGTRRLKAWSELVVPIRVDVDEDAEQLVLQPPASADDGDVGEEDLEGIEGELFDEEDE